MEVKYIALDAHILPGEWRLSEVWAVLVSFHDAWLHSKPVELVGDSSNELGL